jgi:predicted DNA-binding transcriptional regulator AlpA
MLMAAEPETPLLVDAKIAATLCGCSVSFWRQQDSAGRVPAPVRLSRKILWRRADLERWVALGCPSRRQYDLMQEGSPT